MRWDDFRASGNVEDRRSGGGFGGGRLGIVGIVIALIVSWITGINPLTLLQGYEQIAGSGAPIAQTQQGSQQRGAPADPTGQFVAKVLGATEDAWADIFQKQGRQYTRARLRTACSLFCRNTAAGSSPACSTGLSRCSTETRPPARARPNCVSSCP